MNFLMNTNEKPALRPVTFFFSQKSTTKSSQARNFLNGPRSSRRCNLDYYRTLIGSRTLEAELTVRQHSRTATESGRNWRDMSFRRRRGDTLRRQ